METTRIKFLADTADKEEIDYCFSKGVDDGITTNPLIMKNTGDLSGGMEAACRNILDSYPNVPISLETDFCGVNIDEIHDRPEEVKEVILKQARDLAKLGGNTVIKVPMCEGGVLATGQLSREGIATNVTACMTPVQALEASRQGATYVSMFANRILDTHLLDMAGYDLENLSSTKSYKADLKAIKEKSSEREWEGLVEKAWDKTLRQIAYVAERVGSDGSSGYGDAELIIGSIRSPVDIYKILRTKPQIVTIPPKIVEGLEAIAEDPTDFFGTDEESGVVDIPHVVRDIGVRTTKELKNVERAEEYVGKNLEYGLNSGGFYHPMTHFTLKEFESAAEACRAK